MVSLLITLLYFLFQDKQQEDGEEGGHGKVQVQNEQVSEGEMSERCGPRLRYRRYRLCQLLPLEGRHLLVSVGAFRRLSAYMSQTLPVAQPVQTMYLRRNKTSDNIIYTINMIFLSFVSFYLHQVIN